MSSFQGCPYRGVPLYSRLNQVLKIGNIMYSNNGQFCAAQTIWQVEVKSVGSRPNSYAIRSMHTLYFGWLIANNNSIIEVGSVHYSVQDKLQRTSGQ